MSNEVHILFGRPLGVCKNCGVRCSSTSPSPKAGKPAKYCSKQCAKEHKALKRKA